MSKAFVEFDQWVICPKCQTAMVGEIDEECFICHVPMQATPLYPETVGDIELRGHNDEREYILAELGIEYTDEEEEVLFELGL